MPKHLTDLPLDPHHLRQFAQVEVPLQPSRPTRRLVHVLDWHFVPREAFEADTPGADYEGHLELVRTIQANQRKLLESLAWRAVYIEGRALENLVLRHT